MAKNMPPAKPAAKPAAKTLPAATAKALKSRISKMETTPARMPKGPIGQEEIQKVRLEPAGKRKLTKGEFSDYSPKTGKPVTVKPLKARARAASEPAMVKKLDRLIGGARPGKPRKFDVNEEKVMEDQLRKGTRRMSYTEQEFDKLRYRRGNYDPATKGFPYEKRPETKDIDNDTLRKMARENAVTRMMKESGRLKSRPSGGDMRGLFMGGGGTSKNK